MTALDSPTGSAFSFLGLKIERKTDLLAATAFLLALITTGYQFWGFVRGADLTIYAPDRIVLFYDGAPDGRVFLRFAGDVTFINSGQVGHDLVVRDVDATLFLDGKSITRQRWLNSVRITRIDGKSDIVPLDSARPVQVGGGAAISQTLSFAARSEDCGGIAPCPKNFVFQDDFTTLLEKATKFAVEFEARSFGQGHVKRARCEAKVTEEQRLTLAMDNLVALVCTSNLSDSP